MFVDIEKCTNGPDGLQTRESLNFALLDLVRLRINLNERTLYERDKFCFWWNWTPRHVTECVTCIIFPWQNRSNQNHVRTDNWQSNAWLERNAILKFTNDNGHVRYASDAIYVNWSLARVKTSNRIFHNVIRLITW